jgi:hypothetical protein
MPFWKLSDSYEDEDCPVVGLFTRRPRTAGSLINVRDGSLGIQGNDPHSSFSVERVDDAAGDIVFHPSGISIDHVPSGHVVVTDQWLSGVVDTGFTPLTFTYELKFDVAGVNPKGLVRVTAANGEEISPVYRIEVGDEPLTPSGFPPRYDSHIQWIGVPPSGDVHRTRVLFPASIVEPGKSFSVEYPAYLFGKTHPNREFVNPRPLYIQGEDFEVGSQGDISIVSTGRLANVTKIALQHRPDKRVRLLPPVGDETDSWHPRVNIGSFVSATPSGIPYSVPEYEPTNWDESNYDGKIVRSIKVTQEKAKVINPRLLRVSRTPILIDVSGVPSHDWRSATAAGPRENSGYPWYVPHALSDVSSTIDFTVQATPGEPKVPYTLSEGVRHYLDGTPSGVTIYNGSNIVDNNEIADWDSRNGLIRFRKNVLNPNRDVFITYRYTPYSVEATELDINPKLQTNIWASGAIRVVLTPEHLAWHYASDNPSGIYNEESHGAILGPNRSDIPFTSLASGVILGDYTLNGYSPDEIEIVDIRREGGQVKPNAFNKQQESQMYVDVNAIQHPHLITPPDSPVPIERAPKEKAPKERAGPVRAPFIRPRPPSDRKPVRPEAPVTPPPLAGRGGTSG